MQDMALVSFVVDVLLSVLLGGSPGHAQVAAQPVPVPPLTGHVVDLTRTLTEDQQMIRDSAEGFFKDEAPVSQHRSLRDSKNPDGFSRDVWAKMAEMGFAGNTGSTIAKTLGDNTPLTVSGELAEGDAVITGQERPAA